MTFFPSLLNALATHRKGNFSWKSGSKAHLKRIEKSFKTFVEHVGLNIMKHLKFSLLCLLCHNSGYIGAYSKGVMLMLFVPTEILRQLSEVYDPGWTHIIQGYIHCQGLPKSILTFPHY